MVSGIKRMNIKFIFVKAENTMKNLKNYVEYIRNYICNFMKFQKKTNTKNISKSLGICVKRKGFRT